MTTRPTRATIDGRTYLDLQNLARRTSRPTDELHQLYALEGFLARLSDSQYAAKLVLKGGVLLAAYDTRRPTRDVDLQGRNLANDVDRILGIIRDVAGRDMYDGLIFDIDEATAETIRDGDDYSGVRISLTARLSAARLSLHVDVSVGDPIWPAPTTISLPRILDGHITLTGYPLPMVHAEKIVTAMQRGTANTRWRDFADIYLLAHRHDIDGRELGAAIGQVASYRNAPLVPLKEVLNGYAPLAQARWSTWRRKNRVEDRLPPAFGAVLEEVIAFADPALTQSVDHMMWRARATSWVGLTAKP